ncbi:MAG: Hsp20/alpha crystallin family protein [Nitrospirae bacterium]|nr:MAG: Hsp20/alpha crystallin family protein [Nitrospirota bacterium]
MMLRVFERNWNPWYAFERMEREMEELQKRMAEFFGDLELGASSGYPSVNLWQNHEGAVLYAEVPGIEKDDLEITVTGKSLTIKGKRNEEPLAEGERYHLRERRTGEFSRTIELPYHVETDKITAKLHNGVLEVKLPRAEEEKPRKISLN